MQCCKCQSGNVRVVMTKEDQHGCTIRRRHCRDCDARFYTVERVLKQNEELLWDTVMGSYVRTDAGVVKDRRVREYAVRVLMNAIETLRREPEAD